MQTIWKNNSPVLLLSTGFNSAEPYVNRRRKRPSNVQKKDPSQAKIFHIQPTKILPIPAVVDFYNHYMNGVDVGDQLRAAHSPQHRIRRGGFQAMMYDFILGTF